MDYSEIMITRVSECTITPSSSAPPQHMYLPSCDSFFQSIPYNRGILFFDLNGLQHCQQQPPPPQLASVQQPAPLSSAADSFIMDLKTSLAVALVEFFPLAGRLLRREADGRLALNCNGAGVQFMEATVNIPFSGLREDGFQHKPYFDRFAPHGDALGWNGPEFPLLSIQVTKFLRDEGLVLGFGYSHVVADGSSIWHFFKSWAECARGIPLSMHPLHMREELRQENLILPPAPHFNDAEEKGGPPSHAKHPRECKHEVVLHNFHFSSEMVSRLKYAAMESSLEGDHTPISSFQALGAHIWRRVTMAKDMDPSEKTAFSFVANMRSRLVPPLPEGYFGNVLNMAAVVATKQELQAETLGQTALRIHRVIKERLTDKATKEWYGKMEAWPISKIMQEVAELDIHRMERLAVANSPKFPVYEVDFGWGMPAYVRNPSVRSEGDMSWFPAREGKGSVDVALAMQKPVMDRLLQPTSSGLLVF